MNYVFDCDGRTGVIVLIFPSNHRGELSILTQKDVKNSLRANFLSVFS